jgi:hypothetical protein
MSDDIQLPIPTNGNAAELMPVVDPDYLADMQAKLDAGEITQRQWDGLIRHFEETAFAPVQPAILCEDTDCTYIKACPLKRNDIPRPLGKPCPIEETARRIWFEHQRQIVMNLGHEALPSVDLGISCDLVSVMMQIQRVQWEMVKNPAVAERIIKGYDKDGEPLVDVKMSPLFYTLKALQKMKKDLLESQILTREARAKDTTQRSEELATLLSRAESLVSKLNSGDAPKNADGTPIPFKDRLKMLADPEPKTVEPIESDED